VAQSAATRRIGEVDLKYISGRLVFNGGVSNRDVKVDAAGGQIIAVDADD